MRDFAVQRRPNSSGVEDGNRLNRQSEKRDGWTGVIGDNKCSSVCVCVLFQGRVSSRNGKFS